MLTLFTTAKPFKGHNAVIQRNALQSWKLLHPDIEIILVGDDEGAAEICAELGFRHEPEVAKNEFGAIRVDDIFVRAQAMAQHEVVCYSNCDIVLLSDFWKAFQQVRSWKEPFLLIGKRWDTDLTERLDMTIPDWEDRLRALARREGVRREFEVDYFLFPRGFFREVPPFGLGRLHWDHWLVWKARSVGAAVIDASRAVTAVHQNHDYNHHPQGWDGIWKGQEPLRNRVLAGNGKHLCTYEDATHLLTRHGLLIRTPLRKTFHEARRLGFHILLHKTAGIRKALGLRKASIRKLFSRSSAK
jgi:hypothetical protein